MAKWCKCGHRKKDHDDRGSGGRGTCLVRVFSNYLPADAKKLHSCAFFCQCTEFKRVEK